MIGFGSHPKNRAHLAIRFGCPMGTWRGIHVGMLMYIYIHVDIVDIYYRDRRHPNQYIQVKYNVCIFQRSISTQGINVSSLKILKSKSNGVAWRSPWALFGGRLIWYNLIYKDLVGGLEHILFVHILGTIIPTNIFQRGWNHQPVLCCSSPHLTITIVTIIIIIIIITIIIIIFIIIFIIPPSKRCSYSSKCLMFPLS